MSLLRKLLIDNTPKDYIKFADPAVEKICAENWGDGTGITYAQAAAVTTLDNKFKGNTEITSFDELQYFYGLTIINKNAFSGCTNLQSVIIPETTTKLDNYAFNGCLALEGDLLFIDHPSLTEIGAYALENCNSMSKVVFSAKIDTFGRDLLGYCANVNLVELKSENINYIDRGFLNNCTNLEFLILHNATPPSLNYNEFLQNVSATAKIYLPDDSITAYINSDGINRTWKRRKSQIKPLSEYVPEE